MVKHVNIQQLPGLDDLLGDQDIVGRGRRVAGRVVVNDDDRGRVVFDRLPKYLGDPHAGAVERADRDRLDPQDVIFRIQQHCPQMLLVQVAHLQLEQAGHISRRGDLQALVGRRQQQAAPDFDRGLDVGGLGLAHAVDAAQASEVQPLEARPAVVVAQELLRQLDHIHPLHADPQQDGQQLGVRQRLRAVVAQPFARLFAGRQVLDRDKIGVHRPPCYPPHAVPLNPIRCKVILDFARRWIKDDQHPPAAPDSLRQVGLGY
jgi:hypothetical protein